MCHTYSAKENVHSFYTPVIPFPRPK
uniref:Uncharacterized protein n=1 Tax=Anguilla anguilla TaxID=7936 RepID=A0A0E9V8C3_ANGAN